MQEESAYNGTLRALKEFSLEREPASGKSYKIDVIGRTLTARRAMNVDEFCQFTGLSKQTAYKLTSTNQVPFAKRGKRIWFDREEVENWLLSNQRATRSESERQADEQIMKSATGRTR
jgi:excisionase family DNA binding protein